MHVRASGLILGYPWFPKHNSTDCRSRLFMGPLIWNHVDRGHKAEHHARAQGADQLHGLRLPTGRCILEKRCAAKKETCQHDQDQREHFQEQAFQKSIAPVGSHHREFLDQRKHPRPHEQRITTSSLRQALALQKLQKFTIHAWGSWSMNLSFSRFLWENLIPGDSRVL